MRFDFVDLRLFLHVAEARSITHGAERAHLALASASARVRGMEDLLGVPLLKRDRRGVTLTAAGRSLADHARLVLQQVEHMRGELGAHARGLRGNVHVLSNTAALTEHLPELLASFLAANPTISIDLDERESTEIVHAIAAGSADVGIASNLVVSDALVTYPFRRDRLVLAVRRADKLVGRSVWFREVVERDFVGLTRDSALQNHLAGHAARLGSVMNLRARVKGFDAVCRMVAAGVGVAVVPESAAKRCRRAMAVGFARLRDPWAERRLAICVRRSRTLPAPVRRLVEHLAQGAEHSR